MFIVIIDVVILIINVLLILLLDYQPAVPVLPRRGRGGDGGRGTEGRQRALVDKVTICRFTMQRGRCSNKIMISIQQVVFTMQRRR